MVGHMSEVQQGLWSGLLLVRRMHGQPGPAMLRMPFPVVIPLDAGEWGRQQWFRRRIGEGKRAFPEEEGQQ